MRARPGPWPTPFRDAYIGFSDSLDDIRHLSANKVTDEPLTEPELDAHRQFLDEVNARIDREGLTLDRVVKDDSGRWNDEFYEWMLDTVENIYDEKGYAKRPKENKALVTGGLGGAGKTTTLKKMEDLGAISQKDWITVNPDDMKEEMIARGIFPEIEGVSTAEMAHIMHGVSSELAHLLGERAMSEGHNVIFDVTMGGGPMKQPNGTWGSRASSIVNDINVFPGYDENIDALFMDISADQSVTNAQNRHRRGLEDLRAGRSSEGGRYVAESIIRSNDYKPGPGADGQPNPIGYGLTVWDKNQKVVTPYEERYGTGQQERLLAAQAEEVRAAIFSSTKESAGGVDDKIAQFEALLGFSKVKPERATEELAILREEWLFMDPRTTGVDPATRFKSVNAYNFTKAVDNGSFTDYAVFDNSDLDHPATKEATGKYKGITLPESTRRKTYTGPMTEGLAGTGESANVQEVMDGLENGTHELASVPTSDANGKFRLHVPMLHSDESQFSQWLEYESAEARDAALAQARELQDEAFAKRSERISALGVPEAEAQNLADGLVDMPATDGSTKGNMRGRFQAQKRLQPVKLPTGQWGLRDDATGLLVGAPGDRQAIASRRDQMLNYLYPRLG